MSLNNRIVYIGYLSNIGNIKSFYWFLSLILKDTISIPFLYLKLKIPIPKMLFIL